MRSPTLRGLSTLERFNMNTTVQRRRPHPVDRLQKQAYSSKAGPVREVIEGCLGRHQLTAVVEEDIPTLTAMRHVPGLIAFLCTLVNAKGQVIAQGRGNAVLNPNNRFIERAVACAFNSALTDAAIRATKVLDLLRGASDGVEEAYSLRESDASESATDKQRQYLRQLILANVDEEERERWEGQIGEMTKAEASRAIEQFKQ